MPSKGLSSERAVLKALEKVGWKILGHDLICARVQIDLLVRNPAGTLTIVEVKSQSSRQMAHLSFGQFRRLQRAAAFLAQCEPVQIYLALRGPSGIRCFPVDALTLY